MTKLDFKTVTTHVQLRNIVINKKRHCALGLNVVTFILELFEHLFCCFLGSFLDLLEP